VHPYPSHPFPRTPVRNVRRGRQVRAWDVRVLMCSIPSITQHLHARVELR
jgi:hypothetical protein